MYVLYFSEEGVKSGGSELVQAWQAQGRRGFIWLDLDNESPEQQRTVLDDFEIHPLAAQDAMRQRHPPKLELFDDFVFILLRGLDARQAGLDFGVIQLALFAGENFLISRHSGPSISVETLRKDILDGSAAPPVSPIGLALQIANKLSRRYVDLLLSLEARLDEIEAEMFEHLEDGLLNELTQYKSKLRQLQRITLYHTRVAQQVLAEKERLLAPDSLEHEGTDLFEQNERANSLSELYYNIAQDLSDSYIGLSSHKLNRVMQILTVITVIFVPLTFIAGIYGMNFEHMPELKSSIGYFAIIGVMSFIAALQLIYFRRKKWI